MTMSTYTFSKDSPLNTALRDPEGNIAYQISTPFAFGSSETAIKRGGQVIATIQWKAFRSSTLTMRGESARIKDIFPRTERLSTSRVYTMPNGESFKWEDGSKFHCVSVDSKVTLATYTRRVVHWFKKDEKPTLDIIQDVGVDKTDALVVTWVIAEEKVRRAESSKRHRSSSMHHNNMHHTSIHHGGIGGGGGMSGMGGC
ncbi:hypothetical protein RSOLAG22IIIB_08244 [Rhizoctonia solani]|uniref:DUF6593 domain-containing protein n=1 Tax=Rhizoctonia solani TaxID=456999 RepID=A0A0K6FSE0_9AGAM|nr:hypothetical protein RSOLAG22IIIB_08244 [Rhizoctonia solani]